MTASTIRPQAQPAPRRPAPAPRVPSRSFAVYYGQASLEKLRSYRMVALQPAHYSPEDILWLRAQGVTVLAYLSVGEDPSPERCVWSRRTRNAEWGTWYVKVGHAAWTARLYAAADEYLGHFSGLLLDTLDGATLFPSDRSPLLRIVRNLRRRHPQAYLLANRGFDLLPELGQFVDGVLIESFTTSWLDGYRKLRQHELAFTGEMLRRIRTQQLDVFALDYALTDQQRRAALVRARSLGVSTFVGVRELNTI
ncbi:endo alpha-1,4 polygalactosaminidase [Deinococcus koreensis]|uniref:Glycoside-hydrolase family GH114 TIM-barrel domain-containing protein n=1 Tax=Deinococcus koreensis TaxID=2054903 RepID=A0A2K3USB1_9DEIO|nr:endo alpha-1,4 polygalactosaminidase [Deinococcus koreensis]PNY79423.1 hypothetical protein CVO96_18450 [Deinococcus koreensis]